MPNRFVRNLRDMNDAEVRAKLKELRAERFHVSYAFSMGTPPSKGAQNPNTALMRNIRRNTARCLTVLTEREKEKGGRRR